MYDFLGNCALSREPGEKYEYSNLGMGLAGHILSLKAGTNYEELVVNQICEPLKMKSTRITLDKEMGERLARGHVGSVVVKNWDLSALVGAGALRSTANDMLKYVEANMSPANSPLGQAMQKTHLAQNSAGSSEMSIGLAWHVRKKFGSEIVWHNGGTGGYHSFCGFDKLKKRGVVLLANSTENIDDIGWHLLNPEYKLANRGARRP
jgi:CubicO group peptidase (beta-lactamase class C family)